MEHEAPIELCREHPEVVPALLSRILKVELPYYSRVRVTDPNTRALVVTGKRSDAAVILEERGKPVMAAILEPQGGVDPDKWWAWPKYIGDLHAEVKCDSYLIVLALTRSVAAWAREPIRTFQPGRGFRPYVVGPDDLPRVGSVEEAREQGWLGVLGVLMHANEPDGEKDAVRVLQATRETAGPEQAWWLYQLVRAIMSEHHCQRMQEIIMVNPDLYLPKTDFERQQFSRGLDEGTAKGTAKGAGRSILRVLAARQVEVSAADRERILNERDLAVLDLWLDRALTARSTADLF